MKKSIALLLSSLFINTALAQEATPGSEWLSYNKSLEAQRFSSLSEINTDNISQLGEVCRVQIDGPTSFHAGLIIDDGVIYTNTARETVALDAKSCELVWKFDYQPDDLSCGGTNRGMALQNGRLFRGTCDGRLIALDAQSGELLWKNVIAVDSLGESTTGVPLAWQNIVFMGIAGSELGARGRIMAYDATTGSELWRFNTIPMGDEVGAETWERPESAKTGGGGVWGAMSLDVSRGELMVPVGNPWPDIDIGYRPGENLFTNSIVILDAFSGKLKWWYQISPRDWQDFDLVAAPVLYRDEQARDLMAIGGKDGYVTVVDRDTHELVFRTPVTTIEEIYDMPSREGTRMCPGYAGGVEWNGPALNPETRTLIVGAVDACFIVTLGDTEYSPGEASFGGTIVPDGPVTGWITALDSLNGEIRWQYQAEMPVVAAITPTAGGITLAGDLAGNFLVFNSENGDLLHQTDLGGAMAGGIVTYELDGKQYIAANVGNISRNAFGDLGMPSVVIMTLNPQEEAKVLDITSASGLEGINNGRRLFSQVCSSCHGTDGNLIADKRLSNISDRLSMEATIEAIKNPKEPMPKLFPDLINEQSVSDVAQYLHEAL